MNTSERTGAGTLRLEDEGRQVTIAGWVQKQRDFGELVFFDVRDRSGLVQVVVDQKLSGSEALTQSAKELRAEFVVRVTGTVAARSQEGRNQKMATGEIEIRAESIELLNRSEPPPFQIEDETTATEETRLRHRYLDLRRPALTRNLVLRDRIAFGVRDYMHRHGFLEIETPILTKSTPEGARDYLVPSRVSRGQFYALPQSPQLFKQLLMVSGLERYYQIARCFRDEDLRRDRQPEFTQIDIEASFIDEEFVFGLIEGLFSEIFPLAGISISTPFPRMKWQEAMDRFGIDRPDTRFGMELIDLGAFAAEIEFAPFRSAIADGGLVRGIVVPGGAAFSRKRIDDIGEMAKKTGAAGVAWVKFDAQKGSSLRKFMTDAAFETLRASTGAGEGDLLLIVAGPKTVVWDTLGSLRLHIAAEEKMIPEGRYDFLWVVDFPLYEYDAESGRYFARHHPFTSPAREHLSSFDTQQESALARAYDVVLNGLELGGGSIRINDQEVQSRMFAALGIGAEQARERFGFLLDAFRYGAPPHGGIALGLDRMVMLMAGAPSLRDVIAFPKTASGSDLMTDAPSTVDAEQLQELGLSIGPRTA